MKVIEMVEGDYGWQKKNSQQSVDPGDYQPRCRVLMKGEKGKLEQNSPPKN